MTFRTKSRWVRSGSSRVAVLGLLAILIVAGAGWFITTHRAPPPFVERTPTGSGPRSFADAIVTLDRNVDGATRLAQASPNEWLVEERLAHALMGRARLTGSFADYAAAQSALDRGFAGAPQGTGPHLTRMALDFAMHRLDHAAKMVDAIERYAVPDPAAQLEATLTRGDIAFYRGDYSGALAIYKAASGDRDDAGALLRIANLDAHTGKSDEALGLIDQVERSARLPSAHFLADLALRRGTIELQRGRWTEASRHFDRAARLFPGWWLAEAHQAQMLALTGQTARATAAFLRVARKSGSPEAMDALASLYRAAGDRDRSTFWADQARMIWNERLGRFPEASYGHAVEHILAFGAPPLALALAQRDHTNRPFGQTATALAWALIANNDPTGALKRLGPVLQSQWVSAESHLAAAQAQLLLGRIDDAEAERRAAIVINPHAADRTAALSWFGH